MTLYAAHAGAPHMDMVLVVVFALIALLLTAVLYAVLPVQMAARRNPEAVERYREREVAAVPESRLARIDWGRYQVGDWYVSWFEDPDDFGDAIAAFVMGLVVLGLAWWMVSATNRVVGSGFGFG